MGLTLNLNHIQPVCLWMRGWTSTFLIHKVGIMRPRTLRSSCAIVTQVRRMEVAVGDVSESETSNCLSKSG